MREVLREWTEQGIGPSFAVQPVPEHAVTALTTFRNLASAVVRPGAADLPSRATLAIATCIGHLLDTSITLDDVYLDLVKGLFRVYPTVLGDAVDPRDQAVVTQLLDRLSVLRELYGPKPPSPAQESTRTKFLGEYLIELGHVTDDQLRKALAAQKAGEYPGLRMGDILQKWGIITRAQLDEAIELQMIDQYDMQ